MDATINTILAVDETAVTATPTWAIVMVMVGVLVAVAFDLVRYLQGKAEKAEMRADHSDDKAQSVKSQNDDKAESVKRDNEELHRQLLLSKIESIGDRMKADQAEMRSEMKAALAGIQTSVNRHDGNIDELYRLVKILMEWKVAMDALRSNTGGGLVPRKAAKKTAPKRRGVKARKATHRAARATRPYRKAVRVVAPRIDQDWAVRELDGPVPGPVSVGHRKALIEDAIDAIHSGTRRGRRSTMWQHFSRSTIFECMVRILVGCEPAQAVARHVCGVNDPESDIDQEAKAKRLQELLSTLRRKYGELQSKHEQGERFARALDEGGEDFDARVRRANVKLAMVIDALLVKAAAGELTVAEGHLLSRNFSILNDAREQQAKIAKDEASTERVKKQTAAESGAGREGVPAIDQGIALELVLRGLQPTPEAIAARKREKAEKAKTGGAK